MMKIWYRAKRTDNKKWVYGYPQKLVCAIGSMWIMNVPPRDPDDAGGRFEIDPSTLGQHIGTQDTKGNDVYDGDKLKDDNGKIYTITWGHNLMWLAKTKEKHSNCYCPKGVSLKSEVVGNIHDDPRNHEDSGQ